MPINAVSTANIPPMIERQQPKTQTIDTKEQATGNNNQKALIGVGAALSLVTLGVLGHKGYLGEGIQKALGGAAKAAKEEGTKKAEETSTAEVKKSFKELYNDAIKEKKDSIKNEVTGRTHSFEYAEDGKLIKETVSQGDDYAVYKNINGKMRIIEAKKGETVSLRHFNEDGTISRLKPEVPIKVMPRLVYDGELPKKLTAEEIPEKLNPEIVSEIKLKGEYSDAAGNRYLLNSNNETIHVNTFDKEFNITQSFDFNLEGTLIEINKYKNTPNSKTWVQYTPDGNVKVITCYKYEQKWNELLQEWFDSNGKLNGFYAMTKEGKKELFFNDGELAFKIN